MSVGTYERRKANGECVRCGIKNDNGYVMCWNCKAEAKILKKEWREAYVKLHICTKCHEAEAVKGERLCIECREEHRQRSIQYGATHKAQVKAKGERYVADKLSKGLCVRCGKKKAEEGKKRCARCLAKARQYQANKRIKEGIIPRSIRVSLGYCYICGNEIDRNGSLCNKCCAKNKVPKPVPNTYWKKDNQLISYRV